MPYQRSKLQQQVVDALIDSKAINLEAVANVMATYGEQALRTGEDFATIINGNAVWNCGIGPAIQHVQVGQLAALEHQQG